jgi:hypothetical protein
VPINRQVVSHKPIREIDTSLVADSDGAFVLIEVNPTH